MVIVGYVLFWFRNITKKASAMTKFQTYSKSVNASIIDSGVYTEHGIVYDPINKTISAQHKRSRMFYESVL